MPYIPMRDGAKLHVRTLGRGQPVVLLHGFGSNSTHWLPNVLPLLHRYRFILPDLRGFGRSHAVGLNQANAFTNYVEDIADVLDHLGLNQVILGGISMGALTGLQLNQHGHFHRVSRYLHIDQAPQVRNLAGIQDGLFGTDQEVMFSRFRKLTIATDTIGRDTPYWDIPLPIRREMMEIFGEFFGYAMSLPIQRVFWRQAFRHGERVMANTMLGVDRWDTYMQIMETYVDLDTDTRPSLSQIQVPLTMMVGMRSLMYPPSGQMVIRDHVPHARVVAFERAGHLPMLDQPIRFQREFTRFLEGQD